MKKNNSLYEIFKNPDNKYRPVPFWSWNDDLQEEEIKRQILEIKKGGYGGFYIHSRPGLKIPYLKERWMELVNFAIKEAEKVNLDPWLYDEDKWPSGFGSGEIPKKYPDTRFRYLVCISSKYYENFLKDDLTKQLVQSKEHNFFLNQFSKENLIAVNELDGVPYSFYEWIAPLGDSWYNDTCYTDLMNPETVDIFINYAYEAYKKHFGVLFGNKIPGIFTDEPCFYYWAKIPFPRLPWSKNLLSYFESKNGYDLKNHLISLIEDAGDYEKIRYDYYKTISDLFLESYAKKLFDWCKNNDLIFTGHYQMEDTIYQQIDAVGKMMPLYEYEDYPGIDILGNKIGVIGNYLTIKQASSIADQLNKKRVMSETYGGAGWHLRLADQKKMAEIQIALGINFFVPHLLLYSLLGERKRDHPPSIYYQQPYWEYYSIFNDYLTRLCAILSQGTREVNILLIHPVESAWLRYKPHDNGEVVKIDKDFRELLEHLLDNQKDVHLGDEEIISKYGKVKENKFYVGNYAYDFVILPELNTLRDTTFSLLKEFSKNGGKVIVLHKLPKFINCKPYEKDQVDFTIVNKKEFFKNINSLLPQNITIEGKNVSKVLVHVRKYENQEIFFVLNTNENVAEGNIYFKTRNKFVEIWDPISTDKISLNYHYDGNSIIIPFKLLPGESKLFIASPGNLPEIYSKENITKENEIIILNGEWKISSMTPNCLTLDFCQYKIENSGYSRILPVLQVQEELKNQIGKKLKLKYEFELEIQHKLLNDLFLIAEYRDDVIIKLNGNQIPFNKNDWWLDISFKKSKINDFLRDGVNLIEYETIIKSDTEVESLYIIGDFTLKSYTDRIFSIIGKDSKININDLTKCGFQFFSGKIRISKSISFDKKKFNKLVFKLDKLNASLMNLYINNELVGMLAWNPLELDITKYIKKGLNEITIELVSSCRNLLGPHHLKRPEPDFITPKSFLDKDNWDSTYYFIPFGLPSVPKIYLY
jgi:hypothetical protein